MKKVALLAVLALFLILALPGGPAMAASVTADGTASSTIIAANATSATFSHTTGTGSNRLLMVGVSWNCGTTDRSISSVTFTPSGGSAQALTMKITQLGYNSSNPRYSAIYYLVGPPSGTTGDITITFSGTVSNGGVAGAADFAGVDPTTPLGTAVGTTSSNTGTAISQALSGLNGNEVVFDNVFAGSSGTSTTLTAGASQTQEWSVNGYTGSTNPVNCIAGASYQQATSSSLTMSWTLATTAARWCIAAVPINPYGGGTTRTLTMAANPGAGGTTSPAAGGHTYSDGAVVNISATPNVGYLFTSWSGGVTGSTNPTTVTMSADKTVTANFTATNYNLTVNVTPGGGGTTTPTGTTSHGAGEVVNLTATPNSGYLFSGWTGATVADSTKASTTITMDGVKTVTANFTAIPAGTAYQDGTPATGSIATGTTLTFSHTTGTGSNRLLLVGISWNCGSATAATISSVTFTPSGGSAQPLTEVLTQLTDTASAPRYSAVYKLVGPSSGVTGDVTITFGASITNGAIAGAVNFAGVDPVTPLGTPVGAASTNNTTAAVTVAVTGLAGNELVFDNVFNGVSAAGTTLTPDASQTQLWSINGYAASSSSNTMAGASTKQATGTSVTMSWTASSAGWWATVAVPIKPFAGGTTRTLTMASNPSGGGTTDPATGDHTYADGAVVDISATPNIGYVFSSWSGGVTGSTNPTTVTMNASKTVTANFTAQNYNLTMAVSPSGGGTTTPAVGAHSYGVNTVVDITATPASGYLFDHWTGTVADSTKASTTTTVTAAKTVTAVFTAIPAGTAYQEGTPDTGTAAPTTSSISFSHTTGTGPNRLLLVGISWNCGTTDRSIPAGGVTFTPSGGSALPLTQVLTQLGYNSSNPRYSAIYYLIDPPSGTTGTVDITFSGTLTNGAIAGAANFAGVNQSTPLGTPAGAGSSTSDTTATVDVTGLSGNELVFDNVFMGATASDTTMTAGAGQTEVWKVNGAATSSFNVFEGASTEQAAGTSVTMSWTISTGARWAIAAVPIIPATPGVTRTLTMASNPGGGGSTSPATGDHSYADGAVVNISATPNIGYVFSSWSGGVTGSTNPTTVTMNANKTVTANFTAQNYDLTMAVSPGGAGTTTPSVGAHSYGVNAVVDITATPASGYLFDHWTGDVADASSASTTTTVTAAKTVTAVFTAIPTGVVTQEGTAATGTMATGTTLTFSHTTGTGANRLMLVGISWNCGSSTTSTISSVTFTPSGGSALPLTQVLTQLTDSASAPRYSAVYKLVAPPSGVTGDVTITFASSVTNGAIAGARNFANVNQTTPLGTPEGAASSNNTTGTVSADLTGLAGNELIFDNVFNGSSSASTTLTPAGSQTQLWSINGYTGSGSFNTMAGASTKQATGTSVTMTWTASSAGWWAVVAVPIRPAGGSSTTSISVIQGWNLVAGATGTTFPGDLFAWNGSNYQSVTSTSSWQGYWYKATSAGTVDINVTAGPQVIDLVEGWNLIGNCMSTPAAVTSSSSVFIYTGSGYQSVTVLQPGQGAWVKASSAGQTVTLTGS